MSAAASALKWNSEAGLTNDRKRLRIDNDSWPALPRAFDSTLEWSIPMRVLTAIRPAFRCSGVRRSPATLLGVLVVSAVALLCYESPFAAELPRDNDAAREIYFDGLRERGLYSLAETVCLTQLEQSEMTLPERTAIVVELSRTFAAHAAVSPAFEDQSELLQQARFVIDDLLASSALHPQRLLLEAQSAFVAASEVEVLRWQNELSPLPGKSREQALQLSGSLLLTFADLIERMTDELRNRPRAASSERLSPYRIRGLKRTTEYRLGMVLLDRARLLEDGSADQAEALLAAKDQFRDLAGGEPEATITTQSQLALITVTRLSGDATVALRMCETLLEDQPTSATKSSQRRSKRCWLWDGRRTPLTNCVSFVATRNWQRDDCCF